VTKRVLVTMFALLFALCLAAGKAPACTTFCLRGPGEVLFGRNYDFTIGDALIFVNKRGLSKTATDGDSGNPAKWVAKYGSVTFNQFGRENPTGGMNEMGLVVEQMWLDETEYPKDDARGTLGTQEWMEYLLDTAATTAEAVKNAEGVRIVSDVKVHYLISDKDGTAAAIEFVKGKMIVHAGDSLAVKTLTNDTYEKSVYYKRTTSVAKDTSAGSLDRFTRAAQKTEQFEKQPKSEQEAVNYAFEILANVTIKDYTRWSIVYDQKRGKIYFRTLRSPRIKMIDTRGFDYSCGSPVKILDIDVKEPGDATSRFIDYTRKANRDLIERSFNGTDFLKGIPAGARDFFAAYSESFTCTSTQKAVAEPPTVDQILENDNEVPFTINYTGIRLNVAINDEKFEKPAAKPSVAQLSLAEQGAAAQLKTETIREVTSVLASREMEGRGTAQPGGDKAAKYLADRFARAGLKPAGDGATYLQRITFAIETPQPETSFTIDGAPYKFRRDFPVCGTLRSHDRTDGSDRPWLKLNFLDLLLSITAWHEGCRDSLRSSVR
jgi:penicillin V acylase-like amidase (Ntn superfamily)